ncbi:tripartite motif-containing protein 65-like [Cynara cardunculus var. scolymus]|uniref:RING-type E3 ubiquitin transferase n=1 Tax=Cynara cardunculus var. scolymus TaxID=59895 RepID=A0A118JUY5_CYNCS|nr:tripartite motif-containing protein 65-like [Cynara cardunculus var. scolymus]KVH92784.1 Zinc finger, RING/FYVE/PHD-type [Cynara cardunculus var. scolymus]
MVGEEPKRSTPKQSDNGERENCALFSPGFRSVAAMAGWDEEALLMASLVVEDTPDRDSKQKRRSDPLFKTPPTNSRRKRRDQRKSPVSIPVAVLDLGEEEVSREEILEQKKEPTIDVDANVNPKKDEKSNESSSSIPCIDRLREELSCAICLEICFEPSTTSCGHSFCKKCLKSAADRCGKRCPKCRQLISNGRSCTINTVLWNTIQLLFPQEIEARKTVAGGGSNTKEYGDVQSPPARRRNQYRSVIEALNSPEGEQLSLERRRRTSNHNLRQQSFRPASVVLLNSRESGDNSVTRRRRRREVEVVVVPPPAPLSQDEDAALALRLQRQEFMGAFRGSEEQAEVHRRSSVTRAAVNLRAMASRAIDIRNLRGRRT